MSAKGKTTSDLPFGREFSPSQIELPELLELIHTHQGNVPALEAAIKAKWFSSHAAQPSRPADKDNDESDADTRDTAGTYNRSKLANNCKFGLIAYGIITRDA